jgi:hypothetical protein
MEEKTNIQIYNSDEDEWDVWEIIIDPSDGTFMLYWEDNGFDMEMSEAMDANVLENAKWTHASSRIMLIGLFEIGIKG